MGSSASWRPDWAVAPGEILQEELDNRGISQSELARRMDRPVKTINEIVNAKASITADTAIQLELALGVSARMWLGLESTFREWQARQRVLTSFGGQVAWAKGFPIRDMRRLGILPRSSREPEGALVAATLAFFGVSTVEAWKRRWNATSVAFRRSPSLQASPEATAVWLRWGEVRAAEIECAPFDRVKLDEIAQKVGRLSREEPFSEVVEEIVELLAGSGVAFVMTPELAGTRVSGAARWLGRDKALIQLSLRHKTDDHFWFSLAHELAHLVEEQNVDSIEDAGAVDDAAEQAANKRARDWLIDPEKYTAFVGLSDFSSERVREFARELNVSPGIVVGRLQRDGHVAHERLNGLKRRLDWM